MTAALDFDQDFAGPTDWAKVYRSYGIHFVPAVTPAEDPGNWKRPQLEKWKQYQGALVDEQTFSGWYGPHGTHRARNNMGLITGTPLGGVFILDLDTYKNPVPATWWRGILAVHNNGFEIETPRQTTGGGGRQLVFRAPKGWAPPTFRTEDGIDCRGDGGFAMLPPSMHESGKTYEWDDGLSPLDVEIATAPEWLCREIDAVAAAEKKKRDDKKEEDKKKKSATAAPATSTILQRALDQMTRPAGAREHAYGAGLLNGVCSDLAATPSGRNNKLNESAMRVGSAVAGGMIDRGEAEQRLYAAAVANGYVAKDGPHAAHSTLQSGLIAGMKEPLVLPADNVVTFPSGGEYEGCYDEPEQRQKIVFPSYEWCTGKDIAPRDFIYARHYIRKFVSFTVGFGGAGKSSLALVEALAMTSGKPLLGITVPQRRRVMIWNGEDPMDELKRRIAAACIMHNIKREDVEGYLFVASGRELPIKMATSGRNGAKVATPIGDELIEEIKSKQINALQIDPFISSHSVQENDNNGIDEVVKEWSRVADTGNCSVEIIHHLRKTNNTEVTVDDARGASSLLAAVRSARVINTMKKDEADVLGIENRRAYFRADNGKANMAPPPAKADWYTLTGVNLDNRTETLFDNSDNVAVVRKWELPGALDNLSVTDFDAAAQAIRAGKWRESARCDDWVGIPVARVLKIDISDKSGRARVKGIIAAWIKAKSLEVYQDKDKNRHFKDFVRVTGDAE
jgi:hypothetical protein